MHRLMETYNEFAHGYHGFAALRTPAKYLEADGCGALHCQTRPSPENYVYWENKLCLTLRESPPEKVFSTIFSM